MTVKELIEELEKIENKEMDIVIDGIDTVLVDIEPIEGTRYYRKGNQWCSRECVVLVGWD